MKKMGEMVLRSYYMSSQYDHPQIDTSRLTVLRHSSTVDSSTRPCMREPEPNHAPALLIRMSTFPPVTFEIR